LRRNLFLLLLAVLTACSRSTAPKDEIIIVQQHEPQSLNAALENGPTATELGLLLFNYLLKFNDRGQLVGDVAKAVPTLRNGGISTDGKTITYRLRPDLRFADGTPLSAHDCVYSIQAILNPRNNVQTRYGYDRILRADAPNNTTLVLHLRAPFAPIFTLVLAPQGFPILPAHLLEKLPDFNHIGFSDAPIGGGPFVVRRWYHGDRVELVANPYYYRGKPHITNLTIRFVPDSDTAINQLRTREADVFFNDQDMRNVPLLQSLPGVTVLRTPVNAVGALIFNTQAPATSNDTIRRALVEAIDIGALVRKTYRGAVEARGAGRGLFEWAYAARYPLTATYDPAAARAILGHRHLSVLLAIQANTPGDEILGSTLQQYERAVGVDVRLKAYQITQFSAPAADGGPIYGGKFQLAYYPFVNGDDPDVTDQFACANVPPRGYNKSRYCDPSLDRLMAQARTVYDRPARVVAYSRIQKALHKALPIALLYRRREIDAFSWRLRGISGSVSSIFWDASVWHRAQR